jgi:hypothetical protein
MKFISVKQPWAWSIIRPDLGLYELRNDYVTYMRKRMEAIWNGKIKDIENRTWSTDHRGWLGIHASQQFDNKGLAFLRENFGLCLDMRPDDFDRGCLIGKTFLLDCRTHSPSKFFFGPFGWVLDAYLTQPFEKPIPYKGRLRLFDVKEEELNSGNVFQLGYNQ